MTKSNGYSGSTSTADDLLTLGQALLLTDHAHTELVKAIEERRLPYTRAPYVQGSHESRLRISRADLERFVGHRFHGGTGRDLDSYDVISTCDAADCTRYAPDGSRCERHDGKREKLPRPLTKFEETAYHEAGHAAAARELGWQVRETTIVSGNGAFGHCDTNGTRSSTLKGISSEMTFCLAGPIAACMAERQDWRALDLNSILVSEEGDPGRFFREARDVRFGEDAAGAGEWLEQETAKAGERAYTLLERNWLGVAAEAIQLLKHHTIDH